MQNQRRNLCGTPSSILSKSNQEDEEEKSNPFASSSDEERGRPWRSRKDPNHSQDFKVEIPEFEGRLDPMNSLNEFKQLK